MNKVKSDNRILAKSLMYEIIKLKAYAEVGKSGLYHRRVSKHSLF